MKQKNKSILIAEATCIKCGKCAKVCPAGVITQEESGEKIQIQTTQTCIACGHCVYVCPTTSVVHSQFPVEKLRSIDYSQLPTPQQVMHLIKTRHSNRAISTSPIAQDILESIVEAARLAPTASNKRDVRFTVITDPKQLKQISDFTINKFEAIAQKLQNPIVKRLIRPFFRNIYKKLPALLRIIHEHKVGNDPILRKATALLIIHTSPASDFGCENANLAYQNASLMAHSLGITQIYMGFIMVAIRKGGRTKFSRMTGIEGNVHAVMALGVPAFKFSNYLA